MYHINTKIDKPDAGYMEAIIGRIMQKGIRISDCNKLTNYFVNLRDALKIDIQTKYNIDNPNSPKQVTDLIISMSDKIPVESKNDIINICYDDSTGKWTSKAEALEKLSDLGFQFAQDLLDFRHAKKYAECIESVMQASCNGFIQPQVSLGKTNRINYSKPGLLTIPKKLLWHIILPPSDDRILYSVDIKNQEPSILINLTQSVELLDALSDPDGLYESMFKKCFEPTATANVCIDTLPENRVYSVAELKQIGTISPAKYSATRPLSSSVTYNGNKVVKIETLLVSSEKGIQVKLPDTICIETDDGNAHQVPVEWEDTSKYAKKGTDYTITGKIIGLEVKINKAERKEFKTSWIAIGYGASIMGIDAMCKTIDGKHVYRYITKASGLSEYRKKVSALAKQGISTIRTCFGTPLDAGYGLDEGRLKRVLLDLPIQGTAADILSLLIKHFYDYTNEHSISDKMDIYFTRHDELIISIDKEWYNGVSKEYTENLLRDMLEHQVNDWVPFKVEISKVEPEQLGIDMGDDGE